MSVSRQGGLAYTLLHDEFLLQLCRYSKSPSPRQFELQLQIIKSGVAFHMCPAG